MVRLNGVVRNQHDSCLPAFYRAIHKFDAPSCRQELPYFVDIRQKGVAMADQIFERVQAVLVKHQQIPPENVTVNSTFDELGIDSLDRINLLFAVEEEFEISIATEDVKSVHSVREICQSVENILVAGSADETRLP
jgi:acyl carrier protein